MSVKGLVNLEGQFRMQENILFSQAREELRSSIWRARLRLNTQSYVLHPNFMLLDVNIDYNPGTRNDAYLVRPNLSEITTAERLGLKTTFFHKRPLTFVMFAGLNHQFIARDSATDVELLRFQYGNRLGFRNRILPWALSYAFEDSKEKELQTGREFKNRRHTVFAHAKKSFGENDRQELSVSFNDYTRNYVRRDTVRNKLTNVTLRNHWFPGEDARHQVVSFVSLDHQTGNIPFSRFQVMGTIRFELPRGLQAGGRYQFIDYRQNRFASTQDNLTATLEHQLYLSLHSTLYAEYNRFKSGAFQETKRTVGGGLEYKKRIPTGRLTLSYHFRLRNERRDGDVLSVRIVNEEHTLRDGEVVLLERPFVVRSSVVVTDENESLVYTEGIDYVLIERGDYLEIQRVPGGLIANGQKILVDYTVRRELAFEFDSINHRFGAGVSLLYNHLDLYFRSNELDYDNINEPDFRVLKTISQRVYGGRLSYGFLSLGAELNDINSNVVPTRTTRYYLRMAGQFFKRVSVSATGNWQKVILKDQGEKQIYTNFSGRISYRLGRRSRLSLLGAYIFQEGRGLDLDLLNLKAEVLTSFRQINVAVGVETYNRDFSGEKINYDRAYIRVERQF